MHNVNRAKKNKKKKKLSEEMWSACERTTKNNNNNIENAVGRKKWLSSTLAHVYTHSQSQIHDSSGAIIIVSVLRRMPVRKIKDNKLWRNERRSTESFRAPNENDIIGMRQWIYAYCVYMAKGRHHDKMPKYHQRKTPKTKIYRKNEVESRRDQRKWIEGRKKC